MTIDELCQEERKLNLHSTRKQGEYPFAPEDSYERKTKRYKEINIDLLYKINKITQEEIQLLQEIEESELIKNAQLTERQLICIYLYYTKGYNMSEIGNIIGITKQGVKKNINSGIEKLKKAYENCKLVGITEVYKELCNRNR
jgi:DNA-directed RNA polymerase specialized sigma subunit